MIQEFANAGLGRIKIAFKHASLSAILTLALRPLVAANFSDKLMTMFLIHIISVPAIIQHLENLTPEVKTVLNGINIICNLYMT
jgi:ubiquitin-protein ligase E3 B